jgi:hypothetical protein
MTQTEYLVSRGAPPLPKGWYYEVKYKPKYDYDRDRWYTIIEVIIWASDGLLSSAETTMRSDFFTQLGPRNILDTAKKAYKLIGTLPELDGRDLGSLKIKEN